MYRSSRRSEQARETRMRILNSAHDLFVTQGYGRTTIVDIAAAAGVSKESVYAIFTNKATLLARVWDITIGGDDDDVVFHERPLIAAIRREPDLGRRLDMQARMATAVARRITPFVLAVRGAAATEPAAVEMLATMDRQRYEGLGHMSRDAAATGRLAISESECHDLIWATSDGTLWQRLVVERGWSDERYARYLARMWRAALLDDPADGVPDAQPPGR
ncbi:TetR family transcriptional regulator [Gordonia sp. DT219]|uniref:TetR/AcrR family transcriptional regulator n=1 Tax=Gordonia sp. DT219 TaxID=3416658 RepID=UPI003CF09E0C